MTGAPHRKTFTHRVQDITFKLSPKWGSIFYLALRRDITIRQGVRMWRDAETMPKRDLIFGGEATTVENFFYLNAEREDRASEHYRCVFGCCTVIWYRGKNKGGYGLAGCPCDRMADPRGALIKEAEPLEA